MHAKRSSLTPRHGLHGHRLPRFEPRRRVLGDGAGSIGHGGRESLVSSIPTTPAWVPIRRVGNLIGVDPSNHPRLADATDAVEVGRLLHDFNTEFETPSPGATVLSERLTGLLAGDAMFAILAGNPAIAVALVSVRPNVWYPGRVGLLDELYVEPSHRNEGIGSAMLGLLHRHAEAVGIDAIEINVDEGDVDAQRLYERHGYQSSEPDTNERAYYYFQELPSSS